MSEIRHIIFDLDGVLVDAKDIHFNAFTKALKQTCGRIVTREEHDLDLDGLPTMVKLKKLGIEDGFCREVNDLKQEISNKEFNALANDLDLINTLSELKSKGFELSVASNATNNTVAIALKRLGIDDFFTCAYGNESVKKNKPSPEIYYKCMSTVGIWVPQTMVVEDTPIGKQACMAAGLSVLLVESRKDVTLENIYQAANIFKEVFVG